MTRRFPAAVLLAAFCFAAFAAAFGAGAAAAAVHDLSDDSFERLTQASTGQTTGTWLVAFAPGGATGALRAALNAVSAASSRAVISASVDTAAAPATAARFFGGAGEEAARQTRAVILFRDRLIYEYPGSLAPHEGQADELLAFATDPSSSSEGKAVPRPASAVDAALRAAREALAPLSARLGETFEKLAAAPAVEPLLAKARPLLERAGISGSSAAVGGLAATLAAAVAVALAGKRAAVSGSGRGRSSSSAGKRPVATRQSSRRSTSKRA